jgi:toxin ParE1/3/4
MKFSLILSKEAQTEIEDALIWYRDKAPNMDKEFLNCLGYGFSLIQKNPSMFPIVHKEYRRTLIRRFPFQIIFTIKDFTIVILAVFHAKRNPERWMNR